MKSKKSFILYNDMASVVEKLPDEKAGQLFKIILDYVNDKNPKVEDLLLQIAFEPVRNQLERDSEKWREITDQRSNAGRLGGIKSGKSRSKRKQKETNEAVTDNVTDTVNATETDNVNDSAIVNDIERTHPLQQFVKTLSEVSKIKTQLNFENCLTLYEKHGEELVKEVLLAMENTKGLTNKYTSVYLTVNNWARLRKASVPITDPNRYAKARLPGEAMLNRPFKPITAEQL